MSKSFVVTEDNISVIIDHVRELLHGRVYKVVRKDKENQPYNSVGHTISSIYDVRETSLEGCRVILIDDNKVTYFLRVGYEISFYLNGFRVIPNHRTWQTISKQWEFIIEELM